MRERTIHPVRHTVNDHMVKIGFLEEVRGETVIGRLVKYLLVNDFKRPLGIEVTQLVVILLAAGHGIGAGTERPLRLERLYFPSGVLDFRETVSAALLRQFSKKLINGLS